MSHCSCSTMSSSSLKWSESNNSYCLLPSPSSSSSITTVSSQFDNERRELETDDDEWPAPPEEKNPLMQRIIQNSWRFEKNISLKDQQSKNNGCIFKATMTKEQILICDSSSTRSTIIPGKHVSMKVVFNF